MYWMYAGYILPYFVAFAIAAARVLPTLSHPGMGALALFVILPAMVIAGSVEVVIAASRETDNVRNAIRDGHISRTYAISTGIINGAMAVAASIACWQFGKEVFDSPLVSLILIGVIMTLAPAMAGAWLIKAAKRAMR